MYLRERERGVFKHVAGCLKAPKFMFKWSLEVGDSSKS